MSGKFFSVRHFLLSIVIVAAGALLLRAFTGMSVWACVAIVAVALLVDGWMATREDDQ